MSINKLLFQHSCLHPQVDAQCSWAVTWYALWDVWVWMGIKTHNNISVWKGFCIQSGCSHKCELKDATRQGQRKCNDRSAKGEAPAENHFLNISVDRGLCCKITQRGEEERIEWGEKVACDTSYLMKQRRWVPCDAGGVGRHRVRGVIKKMSSWLKHTHWFWK